MKAKVSLAIILIIGIMAFLPQVHAEQEVSIIMEKTTYQYCEKLFYVIEVSEITGDPAIVHIRDETGKGSSAIPIAIKELQNPVPSLIPFEAEIFPLGKYFLDVEYSGSEYTAEFDLVGSDNICIPEVIRQFLIEWLNEKMPDGYLIDAFQRYVDPKLIEIPFEINDKNILEIDIPDWVKNVAYWWVLGMISDKDFAQMTNYLVDEKIISSHARIENGI
ncbi:MAG: hypothetical protein OPY06_03155 [Nitrosopumilus sp.]|nr:hypothetical protein [Nitrosopumilus sp.]MDF2423030.1 hypothetical protein [Nitrosopumilus sp.]MDF2424340.1 hypothetical protein [Nitrosopumilus sp.]MDF2424913.1 hypothetical protein [Nitrosopumilus sp.]MDF2430155.1 hypothetical protein [Nitrosopumilus sp.]